MGGLAAHRGWTCDADKTFGASACGLANVRFGWKADIRIQREFPTSSIGSCPSPHDRARTETANESCCLFGARSIYAGIVESAVRNSC